MHKLNSISLYSKVEIISYSSETIEAMIIAAERQKEVANAWIDIAMYNQKWKVHFSTLAMVYGRKNTGDLKP